MQAKKVLAVFLALSMTAAPQISVSASAENEAVQENSDTTPEKETTEESGTAENEETKKTASEDTEQDADSAPVNEEFLQITEKKAFTEGDSILIELVSANTVYNRLYIGNRTDEDKTPVIEGTLDENGRYHYLFYIDPVYLGAKAAYVPGNSESNSWYTDEELYLMLPASAELPVQETEDADASQNTEQEQETGETASADTTGEGTISKRAEGESDSLWKIGALEDNSGDESQNADDSYRIASLEEDNENAAQDTEETEAAEVSLADGSYKADDFSFEGGTGKTKLTCEGITVKNGKTYATIKFSSDKFTKLVADGIEYQPISNDGGSFFEIPVTLNKDMTITGTTMAMTEPHDIEYTIHITKADASTPDATVTPPAEPEPTTAPAPTTTPSSEIPKDGTYTGKVEHVAGTATMFKIEACKIVVKNGKATATITLSSTGYDKLFLGSKEDALKAKDSELIPYVVDKNGKYTYEVPLAGLNQEIRLAARSHRYFEAGDKDKMWYDHTLKFNVDASGSGSGGDGSGGSSSGGNISGGNTSGGSTSGGNTSGGSTSGGNTSGGNTSGGSGSGSTGTGSGGSGSGGSSSSSNSNKYQSKTDGKTSQVDTSAGGLKDGEYGSGDFTFSWSGGTGSHGLNITCDKISVENGQAWAYVTFNSGKWVYLKASGSQYDPVEQGSDYTTFKIPVQLNANNKVVGCTTAMSKPYEIEYTLYFGMDTGDSSSSKKSGSSVSAKAAGNATKLADGQEAETDAGTIYKDDAAPKITGLEYMSSLKLEHSKMFKIHYYSNNMTVLEVTLDDEFGKESVDLTQNATAQTSSDSENTETASEQNASEKSSAGGEEEGSAEQDYAKLYKQNVLRYLLVPEDKADQIPAGIDKSIIVIQLPMDKTYVASDVALEMIDKIGADKNVSAVSVTEDECQIDTIKESLQKGDIISAGTYDQADLKDLVKNKCKLAIVPSDVLKAQSEEAADNTDTEVETADDTQTGTKYQAMTDLAEKFAILKIPMILDRSKDEKDVLAKYEWSKVYGALFGCEKEASKLYQSAVSAHSDDTKESTDTVEDTEK